MSERGRRIKTDREVAMKETRIDSLYTRFILGDVDGSARIELPLLLGWSELAESRLPSPFPEQPAVY